MTDHHPTQIGQTPPSDAELKAWRKTTRAAFVFDALKVVGIYATLAFVIVLTLDGRDARDRDAATIQAIRDTQTEGSPLLKAIQAQQDDIERATHAAIAGQQQLADCIKPKGKCATASRQRSAQYLQLIGIQIFCSSRTTDLPEAEAKVLTDDCIARITRQLDS